MQSTTLRIPRATGSALRTISRRRTAARSLATQASTSTSTGPSEPASGEWQPVLPQGVNPAYDAAISFLSSHTREQSERVSALRDELSRMDKDDPRRGMVQSKATTADVSARVNDPATRWGFGRAIRAEEEGRDVDELREDAVYRALANERWRTEGGLDLLMHRITQMHVVPDLIPPINPSIAVAVSYPAAKRVEPGSYLLPSQTLGQPQVRVQSFVKAEQQGLYTLVMVDPDYPDPQNHTFQEYCHWIVPNIPISHTTSDLPLSSLPALLPYHPPHPVPSTPYHRYTTLLIRQPRGETLATTPSAPERTGFSLRKWLAENGYHAPERDAGAAVHGLHMFREGGKRFGVRKTQDDGMAPHQAGHKREMDAVRGVFEKTFGREMGEFEKVPKEERYGVIGRKGRRVPV